MLHVLLCGAVLRTSNQDWKGASECGVLDRSLLRCWVTMDIVRKFMEVQWLGLGSLTVWLQGSIHCWGTEMPQAMWYSRKKMPKITSPSPWWRRNHPARSESLQVFGEQEIWPASGVLVCCSLVARSYLTLCDPMDCSPPGSSVHGILKNTGVGSHFLLQGIVPTQGSCIGRWILYHRGVLV